ncbi:hypothetical protein [Providencia sp. PROV110]|nr:hypothetical protein [Providencia sp. PROV110]
MDVNIKNCEPMFSGMGAKKQCFAIVWEMAQRRHGARERVSQ